MPGEPKNTKTAAISSREEDVGAVFERLKREVADGRAGASPDGATRPVHPAARADADRHWHVAVDVPIERRPGLRGAVVYLVKRVMRKLMSWYVGPFAADQRSFNHALLRLVDDLDARLRALEGRDLEPRLGEVERAVEAAQPPIERLPAQLDELRRLAAERADRGDALMQELDERLLRLERRARRSLPSEPAHGGGPPLPDYFAFESRMRGSTSDVREKQQPYVDDFRDNGPVLDIGCGRGEFLGLLGDAGIEARGIDLDADMVDFCHGAGLDVKQREALSYLAELDDGSLGGVFCGHVVEHLPPPALVQLLELAAAKLRPDGLFVAETPNPRTLISLSTFFSDLTHAQPLHPETLAYLARQAGFRRVEIRYLNTPAGGRLQKVPLPETEELARARDSLEANFDRLNEVIFGPQDFAVLARA